jgi:hypothetical protein
MESQNQFNSILVKPPSCNFPILFCKIMTGDLRDLTWRG